MYNFNNSHLKTGNSIEPNQWGFNIGSGWSRAEFGKNNVKAVNERQVKSNQSSSKVSRTILILVLGHGPLWETDESCWSSPPEKCSQVVIQIFIKHKRPFSDSSEKMNPQRLWSAKKLKRIMSVRENSKVSSPHRRVETIYLFR